MQVLIAFVFLGACYIFADAYEVTDKVYLDISMGGKQSGRLVIELYGKEAPKTVKNFKALAAGTNSYNGKKMTYTGSKFEKVIKDFMIQAGSLPGIGARSIYGPRFTEESAVKHNQAGIVSMVANSRKSGDSRFLITDAHAEWLDTTNVAFGKVQGNGINLIRQIASIPTKGSFIPTVDVSIVGSGVL